MKPTARLRKAPDSGALDMILFDLECAVCIVEAVQSAVESGNLPQDVCASALFGVGMQFRKVCKDMAATIYEQAPQQSDRGSF